MPVDVVVDHALQELPLRRGPPRREPFPLRLDDVPGSSVEATLPSKD